MRVANLLAVAVTVLVNWTSICWSAPTGKTPTWLSCEVCQKGFNKTINWECRFGCDRYVSTKRVKPMTMTKSPITGFVTRNGSFIIDCKSCIGWEKNPYANPLCKYGCGKWHTYPSTKVPSKTSEATPTPPVRTAKIQSTIVGTHDHNKNINHDDRISTKTRELHKDDSSPVRTNIEYKISFMMIGLVAGVIATITAHTIYKKTWRYKRTSPAESPGVSTVVFFNT